MPEYDYHCCNEDCDNEFSLLLPLGKAQQVAECPKCENTSYRVLRAPNIHVPNPTHGARKGRGKG